MRLYRALLWLYPQRFREEYGAELCRAFEDGVQGRSGLFRFAAARTGRANGKSERQERLEGAIGRSDWKERLERAIGKGDWKGRLGRAIGKGDWKRRLEKAIGRSERSDDGVYGSGCLPSVARDLASV